MWHFRSEAGGIRSSNFKHYYDNDEKIFNGYLSRWDEGKNQDSKMVVLDNGIGDHYAFKNLIPEFLSRYKEVIIGTTYPEVFYDEPGVRLISIAEAKEMYHNLDGFSVYKFMDANNWDKSLGEAYKELYL